MEFTDFLTLHPLYNKCDLDVLPEFNDRHFRWPAITTFCPKCKSTQTFTASIVTAPHPNEGTSEIANKVVCFIYTCASCQRHYLYYLIKFLDMPTAIKVGQYPLPDISIEKDLEKTLGEHAANYKKGLICERQGYGIGAYAYYRRIVEDVIDNLLDQIHDLLDEKDKPIYENALREAQQGIVAKDKIALVKDLIPPELRPDNMNPLGILYETLSEGIHIETDEECLQAATDIREILTQLVEQISITHHTNESTLRFTDSMRKLLDGRSQKGTRVT